MADVTTEMRHERVWDQDDRTVTPFETEVVTMPENQEDLQRDLIDRRIAEFVLDRLLSDRAVKAFKSDRKLVHNDNEHYTDFIYTNPSNPLGKQVIERRPDDRAGSMGRVITFEYRTPGQVQGPSRAA